MATVLRWVDKVSNLDERLSVYEDQIDVVYNCVDTLEESLEGKILSLQGQLADVLAKLEILNIVFRQQHRATLAPNPIA